MKKAVHKPAKKESEGAFSDAKLKPGKKDSTMLAALPYVFGMVVGLLIYLLAKDDKFARYHALQAIMFDIAVIPIFMVEIVLYVVLMITIIGAFIMWGVIFLTAMALLVFRLYMAYSAYQGKAIMLPYLGKMALEKV